MRPLAERAVAAGSRTCSPAPPAPNSPPAIHSITIQGTRLREPAGFADIGESVRLSADVTDAETPVAQLQYNWSATTGSFDGSGATVAWLAPAAASTPADVTITLEVVERYGMAPNTQENKVSGTAAVSLHDSMSEVGEMSRQFLLDFSDSNLRDISRIMRNFMPGCYGTGQETDQVIENRRRYTIVESRVGTPKTTIGFGGVCPYQARPGDACSAVPVFWRSVDHDNGGADGPTSGTDWLAAVYSSSGRRWWLCDSSFDSGRNIRSMVIR